MSAQADIGPRLVATGLSGEALLGKPLESGTAVRRHRQTVAAGERPASQAQPAQQSGYGQQPVQPSVLPRPSGTGAGRHRGQRPVGGDHADRAGQPAWGRKSGCRRGRRGGRTSRPAPEKRPGAGPDRRPVWRRHFHGAAGLHHPGRVAGYGARSADQPGDRRLPAGQRQFPVAHQHRHQHRQPHPARGRHS